ncbi:MAG: hypothetical protein VBE63_15250 [Lamprobacter sp.]|uniref:hypothetical protein n=1 Tax=Lamprobacter sp. TaxID=3100796 RepID=UPI002B25E34F|nr:hypothetical protein [Lamprobacter sp.]MEA3641280.1 hypothetical protein [Lamprobacter sp.]
MSKHTLEITTATIEIKVVRVDGHKMTKATFDQIQFDDLTNIKPDNILGWVNQKGLVVLFQKDGKLLKRRIFQHRSYDEYGDLNLDRSGGIGLKGEDLTGFDAQKLTMGIQHVYDQLFIAT